MPASSIIKVKQGSSVVFLDGTGTPVEYTARYDGDFQCDDIAVLNEEIAIYTNGVFQGSVAGNARPIEFSFTLHLANVLSAATGSTGNPLDFYLRTNGYSGNTNVQTGYDYPMDSVKLVLEGTQFGDSADHSITFAKCSMRFSPTMGEPDTWSVSGICRGGITRV